MIVETAAGRVQLTAVAPGLDSALLIQAETHGAIKTALDTIELVGGAEGDDPVFTSADITSFSRFGKPGFQAELTRAQASRWLDAELHNFLDYTSLKHMRAKGTS